MNLYIYDYKHQSIQGEELYNQIDAEIYGHPIFQEKQVWIQYVTDCLKNQTAFSIEEILINFKIISFLL